MAFFNYSTMQMTAKIVYYGPGLCGKTTNLQYIYGQTEDDSRGEMVSLETQTDRTLFFDLLPLDVGTVAGFRTKIQLYTVPGQVFYNTTRKLVLKGVDGVVFVADSQQPMHQSNIESLANLEENLDELGVVIGQIPLVLQYNKRDLPEVLAVEDMNNVLNTHNWEYYEASALTGQGVFETLRGISRLTLLSLRDQLEMTASGITDTSTARPAPPPAPPPPPAPASTPPTEAEPQPIGEPIEESAEPREASEVTRPGAPIAEPAPEEPVPPAPEVATAPEPPSAPPEPPSDVFPAPAFRPPAPPEPPDVPGFFPEETAAQAEIHTAIAQPPIADPPVRRAPEPESIETLAPPTVVRKDLLLRLQDKDFRRTRRVAVRLALEDTNGKVVRVTKDVRIDVETELTDEALLRLNLALRAED